MKRKTLALTASALLLAGTIATPAQATMVAGWDFSQYLAGFLSIDGATFTDTLDANYSDIDPTFGAGAESASYGTLFLDGSFGSTATPLDGTDPINPITPSLVSNAGRPSALTFNDGAACNVLVNEGQSFSNDNAMIATDAATAAFAADLASIPESGSDWILSFGGRTDAGSATVQVEFSSDGVNFAVISSENLNTVDTLFEVNLGADTTDQAVVRLTFDVSNGNALIDNVALDATLASVPEPSTLALVLAGLVGIGGFGRNRA